MKLLLLGHRGARGHREVAENSFESFDLALRHGCDGFEFDVRKSKDDEAVICHDAKSRARAISNTVAARLQLPTLSAVLERYSRRAFLDIELKVQGLEEKTLAAVRDHSPQRGYVISSFLPPVLTKLALLDPREPLGIICGNRPQLSLWPDLPVQYVMVEQKLVNCKLVEDVHSAGKKIMVWTVNRAPTMERLAKFGVDGIISDQTERLANTLRN
jgi:glycerophosphoryl diester phosphodiesterase